MAETLTIDPTPTAEIVGEEAGVQLTAEEQESLELGTKITDQQDQLLAGKYKNAEELERAYVQLQKKLGENGEEEKQEPQAEDKGEAEDVLPEESQEDSPQLSPSAEVILSASEEFEDSGNLSEATLAKFGEMSSQDLVKAYMEVQKTMPDNVETQSSDISDAQVNEIKNAAGGEQAYANMVNWASDNLNQQSSEAFDEVINSGSIDAIKLAVSGLKAEYEKAVGYEGRMVTGKAPSNTRDVYRSQAELVAAMGDPRYEKDPAYRQDIIEKLGRSDNLQF
jgi:hypothetical protein